ERAAQREPIAAVELVVGGNHGEYGVDREPPAYQLIRSLRGRRRERIDVELPHDTRDAERHGARGRNAVARVDAFDGVDVEAQTRLTIGHLGIPLRRR